MRILVAALIGVGSVAAASPSPEVYMQVRPDARAIDATVLGVGQPRIGDIAMEIKGVLTRPISMRTFREGDESIAIAIVFNEQEIYIGNTSFETDENAQYLGVLMPLESSLDALRLGELAPRGSTIEAIGYSTGAHVIVPRERLDSFQGAQLGKELDYRNHIGSDLVQGLTLAVHDLDQSDAAIKLVFVVGDGNDTNNDMARDALIDLKKRAAQHNIKIAGAIYKSVISPDGDVMSPFASTVRTVNSAEWITSVLRDQLDKITDRIYLTFVDEQLPWDGKEHDFTLSFRYVPTDPVTMTMPDLRTPARPWWRPSWMQLIGGVLAVAFIALGLRIRAALAD